MPALYIARPGFVALTGSDPQAIIENNTHTVWVRLLPLSHLPTIQNMIIMTPNTIELPFPEHTGTITLPHGDPGEFENAYDVFNDGIVMQINQFRDVLSLCGDDDEKYHLCTRKRDELLHATSEADHLQVVYDEIMLGCTQYKGIRAGVTEDNPWHRFIKTARSQSKRLTCLKTVGSCWGREVV